ncbi:MAG: 16S rRNA processing protein RimM [Deltaproteobacteria bacterium]|nr:16S rRNA processing protein RimM [Deltaproteobacteria bacterium]MBW2048651.1 16S rRNA processing protein RimM [Deltaproteobacteria bacterium]MBW2110694.1 16S rRNA processing protein RimM [Deltaproteobacteria bacterium]MBW2351903.1 16S rRNA processing protein RimM [Deltaproteobacteria bacterium]
MNSGVWDKLLVLGKVTRPHGLAGLLRVWSYARSEESFLEAGEIFLRPASGQLHQYRVLSVRVHKGIVLMNLEGLDSVEEAEKFRGAEVLAPSRNMSRQEGEYFWREIIGLRVFSDTGDYLGTVSHIIPAGSNEIYVVRNGDREIFLPATYEIIREIDLDGGKMTVSPMEGLLDLNEV